MGAVNCCSRWRVGASGGLEKFSVKANHRIMQILCGSCCANDFMVDRSYQDNNKNERCYFTSAEISQSVSNILEALIYEYIELEWVLRVTSNNEEVCYEVEDVCIPHLPYMDELMQLHPCNS